MHVSGRTTRLAWACVLIGGSAVAVSAQVATQVTERCGPRSGQGLLLGQVRDVEADSTLMAAQVWTPPRGDFACRAVSDHVGAFAMWLAPGSHQIGVQLIGYCLAEPVPAEVVAGDTVKVIVEMLRSPATLEGPSSDPAVVACEKSAAAWRGTQSSQASGADPLPSNFGSDQSEPDFPPRIYFTTAAGVAIPTLDLAAASPRGGVFALPVFLIATPPVATQAEWFFRRRL